MVRGYGERDILGVVGMRWTEFWVKSGVCRMEWVVGLLLKFMFWEDHRGLFISYYSFIHMNECKMCVI